MRATRPAMSAQSNTMTSAAAHFLKVYSHEPFKDIFVIINYFLSLVTRPLRSHRHYFLNMYPEAALIHPRIFIDVKIMDDIVAHHFTLHSSRVYYIFLMDTMSTPISIMLIAIA